MARLGSGNNCARPKATYNYIQHVLFCLNQFMSCHLCGGQGHEGKGLPRSWSLSECPSVIHQGHFSTLTPPFPCPPWWVERSLGGSSTSGAFHWLTAALGLLGVSLCCWCIAMRARAHQTLYLNFSFASCVIRNNTFEISQLWALNRPRHSKRSSQGPQCLECPSF